MTASDPELLTLHGVRLLGFATTQRVAARFRQSPDLAAEHLLDFEAFGWVTRQQFAAAHGWALTARGVRENERRLAAEVDTLGIRNSIEACHADFLPLNARLQEAVTRCRGRPRARTTTGDCSSPCARRRGAS